MFFVVAGNDGVYSVMARVCEGQKVEILVKGCSEDYQQQLLECFTASLRPPRHAQASCPVDGDADSEDDEAGDD